MILTFALSSHKGMVSQHQQEILQVQQCLAGLGGSVDNFFQQMECLIPLSPPAAKVTPAAAVSFFFELLHVRSGTLFRRSKMAL